MAFKSFVPRYFFNRICCLFILLFFSCSESQDSLIDLKNINNFNKLTLRYHNDKCGEWGGDMEIIVIYREDREGRLFADYSKLVLDCEKLDTVQRAFKQRIVVTKNEQKLILECIEQLVNGKLQNEQLPPWFGYYSEVSLSNSSLMIRDTPSIEWTKFEELRMSVLKR